MRGCTRGRSSTILAFQKATLAAPVGMNQFVNDTEGQREKDRSRETRSEASALAQAVTGASELRWGSGPGAGRDSGGRPGMAQRFLAGGGTPYERETQGKGRVTHPLNA